MYYKNLATATITLAAGDNVVIPAPNPASNQVGQREHCLHRVYMERVDTTTDVTLIFKNDATPAREILPRITLNSDAGKMWLEFNGVNKGVGGGNAFVVNASADGKAKIHVEYSTGTATEWPA